MRIFLIRHARQCSSLCNVDVELAKEGREQAKLLGERLLGYQIDLVYSSDLIRAVETAKIINEVIGNKEHRIDKNLREIDFGDMTGLSDDVIAVQYAEWKNIQRSMKEDLPYPNGECGADVYLRASKVIESIRKQNVRNVLVVTHGGTIRSLVSGYLQMEPRYKLMFGKTLENCSITELQFDMTPGSVTLERFNDYAHLEGHVQLLRGAWK